MDEEKTKDLKSKPHNPRKSGGLQIGVDLEDLSRKAVKYGPLRVIGETIFNLCLMANDQFRGQMNGSDLTRESENISGGSSPKKDRANGRR